MKKGLHPPEVRGTNLDSDWVYRKALPSTFAVLAAGVQNTATQWRSGVQTQVTDWIGNIRRLSAPGGALAKGWGVNSMVFVVTLLLFLVLFLNLTN